MENKCFHCHKVCDEDDMFVVNSGFDDEHVSCESCHLAGFDDNLATQCYNCGEWFTGSHLKVNPVTGEKELCPYCNEVWLD